MQRIDYEGNNAFCTKCGLLGHVAGIFHKGQRKPTTKEKKTKVSKYKQVPSGTQYRILTWDNHPIPNLIGDEHQKANYVSPHNPDDTGTIKSNYTRPHEGVVNNGPH